MLHNGKNTPTDAGSATERPDRTGHGRILVVEDEMFIGLELTMILEDAGFLPVGPATDLDAGLAFVEAELLDAAILDVNIGTNTTSALIAEALVARGVPFLYLTGYDATFVRENMPPAPLLSKPVNPDAVIASIRQALVPAA